MKGYDTEKMIDEYSELKSQLLVIKEAPQTKSVRKDAQDNIHFSMVMKGENANNESFLIKREIKKIINK